MPPRRAGFFAGILLFAVHVAAERETGQPSPPKSVAREAIKGFTFKPPAAPTEVSAVLAQPQMADAPVMMPAYTVRAPADRTLQDLNDAFAQRERLKSTALIKINLTRKVQLELFVAPRLDTDGAGQPRLLVEFFRLRW